MRVIAAPTKAAARGNHHPRARQKTTPPANVNAIDISAKRRVKERKKKLLKWGSKKEREREREEKVNDVRVGNDKSAKAANMGKRFVRYDRQ